ncbi:MAG TPA: hypothetical protein VGZ72_04885 [Stellaceae bacterium]|nr:hypothetical protein [Stellaceae bacterium]
MRVVLAPSRGRGLTRKTLFITESRTGTVLKTEPPVPGRLMDSHM